MRIANIMFGGKRGGLEQALVDSSEALRAQGHDVTAFIRQDAAIRDDLTRAGIPFVQVKHPFSFNPIARWKLQQELSGFAIALLHGNRAGSMTQHIRSIPLLAVAHSRFFKKQEHFTAVLALSETRAKELGTAYVAPNLIRLPNYTPRSAFRTPPVLGVLGRLSHEKGVDLLIDALAQLRKRDIAFTARIGGTGDEEEKLKKLIAHYKLEDAVTFLGWVDDKDAFFGGIDVFVLPSRTENFPLSLLEAMSYGCPIIATRCGGPQEILRDGETGALANIHPNSLTGALIAMLNDEPGARAMGHAARKEAEQKYAMEAVGKQLSTILHTVAGLR